MFQHQAANPTIPLPTAPSSPYEVAYSGATLLTASSGIRFVGAKPWIRVGKSKRFKISTSGATFQLATAGTATAREPRECAAFDSHWACPCFAVFNLNV
jgi:hypothetical protein